MSMKKLLLIIIMCFTLNTYSQDFTYKFTINGVTNLATAKEITDPLRNLFKCYPTFNDSIDTFEFNSTININKSTLDNILIQRGYILKKFNRLNRQEIIKEEEK